MQRSKVTLGRKEFNFVEYSSIVDCMTAPALQSSYLSHDGYEDWIGIAGGIDGLESALRDGWAKAKEVMSTLTLPDVEAPESIRRRTVWGEDGDVLDMDRLREGRMDDCWSSRRKSMRRAPRTINLMADLGVLASARGADLFWRGAAYLLFTDMLEKAGYRVRIIAHLLSTPHSGKGPTIIKQVIKEADMPLDVSALASVVCLAGYKRHYWHRQYDAANSMSGQVNEWTPRAHEFLASAYPNEMHVHGDPRMRSAEHAIKWLEESIAAVTAG